MLKIFGIFIQVIIFCFSAFDEVITYLDVALQLEKP